MSDASMTDAEQIISDNKMRAAIAELIAETSKISEEALWYPLAVATALVATIAGLTAILINVIGF